MTSSGRHTRGLPDVQWPDEPVRRGWDQSQHQPRPFVGAGQQPAHHRQDRAQPPPSGWGQRPQWPAVQEPPPTSRVAAPYEPAVDPRPVGYYGPDPYVQSLQGPGGGPPASLPQAVGSETLWTPESDPRPLAAVRDEEQERADRRYLSVIAARTYGAVCALGFYAQEHRGMPAREPASHALLLLSSWPWGNGGMDVHGAGRLCAAGEADSMAEMLERMTRLLHERVAQAQAQGRLWHRLSSDRQQEVLRSDETSTSLTGKPRTPAYQRALEQGRLWDPRMPRHGIVSTSDAALQDDMRYWGVAVLTLDTVEGPWSRIRHRYPSNSDRRRLAPLAPTTLAGHAWVVGEGGVGVHVQRLPATDPDQRTHVFTANRNLDPMDSRGQVAFVPDLTDQPPHVGPPDLWNRLHALHTALRTAYGPEDERQS